MDDTTVIYYTANRAPEEFARRVREHLLWASAGIPIISVSQKPIDFGGNIHAKGLVPSFYNVYRQILMGAERAKTEFVACAEDDTLYVPEYFNYKPPTNAFYYNRNCWHLRPKGFFYRRNVLMSQCVAPTELMVDALRRRFEKFKETDFIPGEFGEPGRWEVKLGLPQVEMGQFHVEPCTITIRHRASLSGIRNSNETLCQEKPFWGDAKELWGRFYG